MKRLTWIIPATIMAAIISVSVFADTSETNFAFATYEQKVQIEKEAYTLYMDAKYERCESEHDLAAAKLTDYYNDVRELSADENLQDLVIKSETECPNVSEEPIKEVFL